MIDTLITLYNEHRAAAGIIVAFSIFMLIVSLLSLPFLVSLIPSDYFQHAEPYRLYHKFKRPIIRLLVITTKNLLGWILFVIGIIMLFIPGQGILTIVMALILIDFPGKRKMERKLVSNSRILNTINWLREKRNKEPLLAPESQ